MARCLAVLAMTALAMAVLALTSIAPAPSAAAEPAKWRAWVRHPVDELPFPRTERAQAVWASRACWRECGAYCAWGIAYCLTRDAQGVCLDKGNICDRYCQRECRTMGGPYLSIE